MSSKLYRKGLTEGDAVVWSPQSKNGSQPIRAVGQPVFAGTQPGDAERLRDLEQGVNDRVQASYKRGLQEGEAAGRQQSAAQLQTALERLARTIEEIAGARQRLRHEAEEDVVKLALAVARRILYREMATDPSALLGLVRAAFDKLDGRGIHRVRANPQDAPIVQEYFQQIGTPFKIEVFADQTLQRGSAIFETEQGSFDASIDTQIDEIGRGFADLVRRSQ